MKKGIDISYHQGTIDFKKVAGAVDFVILREGYRQTTDEKFFEYVKGCKANNIPIIGVYHFSYALNAAQAKEEAKLCLANMKKAGLGKDVLVFFDFEYDTVTKAKKAGVTLGKKDCIAHTEAFCEYVKSQGYKPGVYSNIDYYRNWYDPSVLIKYVFWLADYTGGPDYKCTIQQYTSSGKVPGINGNVDMNYWYGTDEQIEGGKTVGVTAQDVIKVMQGWIGKSRSAGTHHDIIDLYNSFTPRARGYKVTYSDAYCDTTVSAAFIKLGATALIGGTECGVEAHVQLFKAAGIWEEDGKVTPKPGWIIVYNWDDSTQPNDGYSDHIGIVEKVSGGQIIAIEGNMNGGVVGRRTIPVGWGYIRGYAKPKYAESSSGSGSTPAATPTKSVTEVAKEVINGQWGNGDDRKARLKAAGYDYSAVQAKVNELLKGSGATSNMKPVATIAQEVIDGKWGNGDDRKKKLTAAGYDYSAVQAKVNEILKGSASSAAVYYTVKAGDTLSAIARKYGTTYQKLAQINGIKNPNIITVEQRIRVK